MANVGEYKVKIKESYVDSYGHLNNASYLALFEEARWELITSQGYGFDEIHRIKKGPVILEVQIKFFKEIRLREEVTISTTLLNYNGKIGQLEQAMIKDGDIVACKAVFTFGLFDIKERKLIEPTDQWKKALGI